MTTPATSTEAPTASTSLETAAQLQRTAIAATATPGTQAALAAQRCQWQAGTWQIFPGTADQVATVRQYIRSQLTGHPALDDVILAASELAANAITHTSSGHPGGTFAIHLTHSSPGHIALLVTDQGGPSQPQITRPDTDKESGRGLSVVASLASLLDTSGDATGRTVLAVIPGPPGGTTINRASTRHAYQQVADTIAARIAAGQYPSKLPAERGLAEEFGVSYLTMRRAMAILRKRGLIESIHGRGTFTTPNTAENSR